MPGAEMVTIEHGGHFLPLDKPDEVIKYLREFYRLHTASPAGNH